MTPFRGDGAPGRPADSPSSRRPSRAWRAWYRADFSHRSSRGLLFFAVLAVILSGSLPLRAQGAAFSRTTPIDYYLLLDNSGSIQGVDREIAREAAELLVTLASDADQFVVYRFGEVPARIAQQVIQGAPSRARLRNEIASGLTFDHKRTDITAALQQLQTGMAATRRPGVPAVALLVTDGKLIPNYPMPFNPALYPQQLRASYAQLLRTAAASDVVPSDQVTALFEAAAPLVELTGGEGSGEDLIGRVDLVGVAHETSRVAEMLQDLGHHPQEVITGDETRITYCRVAHGFPAYRLACVRPCQKHYLAATEPMHTRASMSEAPDPIPSAVEFGYTWDPIRQKVAPAIAFGHIVRAKDGYRDGAGPLGRDRRELYSTLRDFRHQEQLQAIAAAVAEDLAVPDARDRMLEFLAEHGGELDQVETEIIRDLCSQRSPL